MSEPDRANLDLKEALILLRRQRANLPATKGAPRTQPAPNGVTLSEAIAGAADTVAMKRQQVETITDPAELNKKIHELEVTLRTGSAARTYRYLRIAMVAAVVAIFISIAVVSLDGFAWLPSISHYYYSPARLVFAGALVAATAALLALSGDGGQRAWLDTAAFFAPLIAIVPTRIGNGEVPGLESACPENTECIPDEAIPYISVGMWTWAILALFITSFAVIRVAREGILFEREFQKKQPLSMIVKAWLPIAICWALLFVYVFSWLSAPDRFVEWAHFASASTFFVIITIVALNQVRYEFIGSWAKAVSERNPWKRIWLLIRRELGWIPKIIMTLRGLIAALMLVDIAAAVYILKRDFSWGFAMQPIFFVEAFALVLFAAFWVIETKRKWNDLDPT